MPNEIIELVDTAIKIGLGSAITGIAAYVVTSHTTNKEKRKFVLEHKLKLLEEALTNLELYMNAWGMMYSLASGIGKRLDSEGKSLEQIPEAAFLKLKEHDKELIETWNLRSTAVSLLVLIDANDMVRLVEEFGDLQKEERVKIIFDKKVPRQAQCSEVMKKMKDVRNKIRKEAAISYKRIMT